LYWLWILAGAIGAGLAVCALLAARKMRRLAGRIGEMDQRTGEDALTGLPAHRVMLEKLDHALATRSSQDIAFLLVDLDGFRETNDMLGRAGGDGVFVDIAERLRADLPADALFGRFEDDEFAIILRGGDAHVGQALTDLLRAPLCGRAVPHENAHVTAGIGIARAPQDGTTAEDLVRRAGLALRAAKRDGRGMVRRFEAQIETESSQRRFLLRELETAVSRQDLDVHYQPVVAADGLGTIGVEALLRWTHPVRGAIAPSVFIPLAEQSGLMRGLGEFVLRRALADAARWPGLFVAVNLSPVQIRDRGLIDLVSAALAQSGTDAARLVLEVTESVLIDDPQQAQARLEALRALGVKTALDDFGTGYSSLSYLQKFPFDLLKIDRAFVASLGVSGNAGAIIQSIVTLGHALGMRVLAEGVETDEQRVLVRLAGCDEMQGFLFAKPVPAAEIDRLLARAPSPRSAAR
jgi:diguanylate cyclase (GGDEF)-like protein